MAHACQEPGEVGGIHLNPSIYISHFQIALVCYIYIVWIFPENVFFFKLIKQSFMETHCEQPFLLVLCIFLCMGSVTRACKANSTVVT